LGCINVWMGRTNIEIDDALIQRAMQMYRLSTKREAVELALRRLVDSPLSRDEALAMKGSGWNASLDEIRAPEKDAGA
jgi:Arc/MetJ family transcription regulator